MPLVFFHYCSFTSKSQSLVLLYVGHICMYHVVHILRWPCGFLQTYTTHCCLCMYVLSFNLSCCHSELHVRSSLAPIRTGNSTESWSSVSQVFFKMAVHTVGVHRLTVLLRTWTFVGSSLGPETPFLCSARYPKICPIIWWYNASK